MTPLTPVSIDTTSTLPRHFSTLLDTTSTPLTPLTLRHFRAQRGLTPARRRSGRGRHAARGSGRAHAVLLECGESAQAPRVPQRQQGHDVLVQGCFTSLACARPRSTAGLAPPLRQGQGVQRAAGHSTTTAVHRHPRGPLGTSVAQDQAMSRSPHRAARWRASATAEHTNHVCTAWLGACCVHACASAR